MTINKSATLVGTLEFSNGNSTEVYVGYNSNTGETIVWQKAAGQRSSRVTGRNIGALVGEITDVLTKGEAKWGSDFNQKAWDAVA